MAAEVDHVLALRLGEDPLGGGLLAQQRGHLGSNETLQNRGDLVHGVSEVRAVRRIGIGHTEDPVDRLSSRPAACIASPPNPVQGAQAGRESHSELVDGILAGIPLDAAQ
jgi:hypothetical protein